MQGGKGAVHSPSSTSFSDDDHPPDWEEEDSLISDVRPERSRPSNHRSPSVLSPPPRRWPSFLFLALLVLIVQVGLNRLSLLHSFPPTLPCPAYPPSHLPSPFTLPSLISCEALDVPATSHSPDAPFLRWAAEDQPLLLSCAGGAAVQIRGATWGSLCGWHPSTSLGAACPWTTVVDGANLAPSSPECHLTDLTSGLHRLCDGRPSCLIERVHLPSSDLCPPFEKRKLVVSYHCTSPSNALNEPRTLPDLTEALSSVEMRASALRNDSLVSGEAPPVLVRRECEMVVSSAVNITGPGWWAGGGLWNQLVSTQQMAVIAWSMGCNLSITAFMPDYNAPTEVRFGAVFDLPSMNRQLCTAHTTALTHPTTSFFRGGDSQCTRTHRPLMLSDNIQPGGWPGWEGTYSFSLEQLKKATIAKEPLSSYYDVLARAVQTHANPGSLWLRGGWDGWAGYDSTVPGLGYLRGLFVAAIRFTPPFEVSATALQRLMGVTEAGQFTFIHFRLEEDLAIMSRGSGLTVEEFTNRMYNQLTTALDHIASLDQPAGSEALKMAERVRAWPIYLGTGLLYSNSYVTRIQEQYPWATFFTKDLFLYEHCGLQRPVNAPAVRGVEWQSRLIEALKAIPWTEGVNECTWLKGAVKGEIGWPNREMWAILDWMLTREVSHFFGPTRSSFTVNAVAAIVHDPKVFHQEGLRGVNDTYTQFAWGLPVEF